MAWDAKKTEHAAVSTVDARTASPLSTLISRTTAEGIERKFWFP
jgi:hypothetical protein